MRVLSRSEQIKLLALMTRHAAVADIAEITGHSTTTIRRYIGRFGRAFHDLHNRLVQNIAGGRLECDETWSYVYAKRGKNIRAGSKTAPPATRFGNFYTWTAIDPDTKLFVGWAVGRRTRSAGLRMFRDLSGRIEGNVIITTDSYEPYRQIILDTFGDRATHVEYKKRTRGGWDRETGNKFSKVYGVTKKVVTGEPIDLKRATTVHIERLHGTMRRLNSRFTRQNYTFSKKLENHIHAHAIFGCYYNFSKAHRGLPNRHLTPAMAAGVTDKIWSNDDLLDEVDAYWKRREAKVALGQQDKPQWLDSLKLASRDSQKPFYVLHRQITNETKVHRGDCRICRYGQGLRERPGKNPWYEFDNLEEARRAAKWLTLRRNSDCAMCLKTMSPKLHRRM